MLINDYSFYPQHLHVHSCYEPGASMEGHIYHASKLGMKYIWLTDHDIRMGRKPIEFDHFRFESGLTELDAEGEPRGFRPTSDNRGSVEHFVDCFERPCMRLSVSSSGSDWTLAEAILFSNGKSHCSSLLSDVLITLACRFDNIKSADQRLIFDFKLSERPPEGNVAHIVYVCGCDDGLDAPYTQVKKIGIPNEWGTLEFYLSQDVGAEIGGIDNTFDTVTVRLEARNGHTATAYVGDFNKKVGLSYNGTREKQKLVASEIGERYGVTPFVATELSCAGMHKNVFSTAIPIIDYEKLNFELTHEDACRYVLENGGTFSLNHPLSVFKRADLSVLDIDSEVLKLEQYFAKNDCFGAKLIEVGFPYGRYLSLDLHLRLWDMLSMDGHFLTGYGCNDAHSIKSGWYSHNNFAAFLGVERGTTPTELSLVTAMRSGLAYTADPVRIKGNISLMTSTGAPMGAVLSCHTDDAHRVYFYADSIEKGANVRWIINGELAKQTEITSSYVTDEIDVHPSLKTNLVRVEIYGADGLLILLTNPIYFVREDIASIEIPEERKYGV